MKKFLSILIVFLLMIPVAFADEDWYYPFGLTSDTTFDEAVSRIKTMYEIKEDGVIEKDGFTALVPYDIRLFDIPVKYFVINRNEKNDLFDNITLFFQVSSDSNGAAAFLSVIEELNKYSKTNIIMIEPHKLTYDINGEALVKTFLDDPVQFISSYEISNNDEYSVHWNGMLATITKKEGYSRITVMFFHKDR